MENGYILIHRKLIEHAIWKNPALASLFTTLLLLSNYQDSEFIFDGQSLKLKRGQLITGQEKLSEITGIPAGSIWRHLQTLQKLQILSIKPSNKFSIITILKYDVYQDITKIVSSKVRNKRVASEEPASSQRGQSNTVNTNNAVERGEVAEPPTPKDKATKFFTEPETQELVKTRLGERGVPREVADREIKKFVSYWTEPNPTGKKQRWQMESTFEINGRLGRWFANIKNFGNNTGNDTGRLEQQRREEKLQQDRKLEEIHNIRPTPESLRKLEEIRKKIGKPITQ